MAAVLGGAPPAVAVIGDRDDDDRDPWDFNSLPDYLWEAADSLGFLLLSGAFVAVRLVHAGRGGIVGHVGSLLGALGSVAIAVSNPLEHCTTFPAIGFLLGVTLVVRFGLNKPFLVS